MQIPRAGAGGVIMGLSRLRVFLLHSFILPVWDPRSRVHFSRNPFFRSSYASEE